jgi:hypothetical protein
MEVLKTDARVGDRLQGEGIFLLEFFESVHVALLET